MIPYNFIQFNYIKFTSKQQFENSCHYEVKIICLYIRKIKKQKHLL